MSEYKQNSYQKEHLTPSIEKILLILTIILALVLFTFRADINKTFNKIFSGYNIESPIFINATITNNDPYQSMYSTKGGQRSNCKYNFTYNYGDKEYTGTAKDTVSFNSAEDFRGCLAPNSTTTLEIDKTNPSKYFFNHQNTAGDSLGLLVTTTILPPWLLYIFIRKQLIRYYKTK